MCCSLNSVDSMKNTTYGLLVEEMQNNITKSEKKVASSVGRKEGLKLVLDLHSNHASFGTVADDYNAFNVFIGGPSEFPVLRERSVQLEPGKEHSLEFSGQVKDLVFLLSGSHCFGNPGPCSEPPWVFLPRRGRSPVLRRLHFHQLQVQQSYVFSCPITLYQSDLNAAWS